MILRATPGIIFLRGALSGLLLPCTIAAFLRFFLAYQYRIFAPIWALVIAVVLFLPTMVVARRTYYLWRHSRRAAALGARLAPSVRGSLPGNLDVLLDSVKKDHSSYPGDGQWEWLSELGSTFNLNFLWDDVIMTYDPCNIKAILATDFHNFVKGDKFRHSMFSVLGSGVFNADNEMWKFHRTMTRPFFHKDRTSDFDIFERHASSTIYRMKQRFNKGYALDFQDLVSRFALDSACDFLFGNNVRSIFDALPSPHNIPRGRAGRKTSAQAFFESLGRAQMVVSERFKLGWLWPLTEVFEDKTARSMRVVGKVLDPIVRDAIDEYKAKLARAPSTKKMNRDETLLDHLLGVTTDPKVLKDEILNIMIAGRDTTAATLTFLFYLLAENPAMLERLREEIMTVVGPSARPTPEAIKKMPFLRASINETLRLFPPVPFNARQAIHETTWPSPDPAEKPIYIPAGATTMYSVFMMHRRTDVWGPDALKFDPDRFLDARQQAYLGRNPFIFLPFNAGPRICLGQQYAYNQMSFMIIRLLQNFATVNLEPDAQNPNARPPAWWAQVPGRQSLEKLWPKSHLTMYANGGLWVKMGEAKKEEAARASDA
ncbi:hypothetical protein HWV62_28216 [Athelia sp. TMB]|nr:hypothetical protein HWV62_28216 [Athelia sp. TMB]